MAEARFTNVIDNASIALRPASAPAPGVCVLEASAPSGNIGWWSPTDHVQPHGQALADGKPVAGNRTLRLKPYTKKQGHVALANGNVSRWLSRVAKGSEVVWKHNALRRSYISYRRAVTKNVAQTSSEAGNSPAIIHTQYLNAQTEQAGKAWFGINPAEAKYFPAT